MWAAISSLPWRDDRLQHDVNLETEKLTGEQAAHDDMATNIECLLKLVGHEADDPLPDGFPDTTAAVVTAISPSGRRLNVWLVTNPQGHFVPWRLAQVVGGVVVRQGYDMVISNPETYALAPGWKVQYLVEHVKCGETIVFDGNLSHGGFEGVTSEATNNMAYHALTGFKPQDHNNIPCVRASWKGKW